MARFNVSSYMVRGEVMAKEGDLEQRGDHVPPNYGKFDHQIKGTKPLHYGAQGGRQTY
ncbi:hypothetical protein J1N35_005133 [Gossypium stocksii]|uniref:Uncharacterized protein n=1 Tax=Gossypium stocksii TaxID=47602 RepID=A0A9D3WEU2_9ROSI|nr:hypothetical protein J1N35_005133 [Gossypium stocksii]